MDAIFSKNSHGILHGVVHVAIVEKKRLELVDTQIAGRDAKQSRSYDIHVIISTFIAGTLPHLCKL